METPQSQQPTNTESTESKRMVRRSLLGFFSFMLGIWMVRAPKYLVGFEGPAWLKVGVLLLPWLVLGIAVSQKHRLWLEDELEILINRRALVFAFYVAFFGCIALEHLQAVGFVPAFAWTNKGLMTTLALLLLAGLGLSKLRYR